MRSSVLAAAMSVATLSAPLIAHAEIAEARRASGTGARQGADPIELDELAEREAKAGALGEFTGGDPVIIIGGSTLLFVLLIVLIVLLLT